MADDLTAQQTLDAINADQSTASLSASIDTFNAQNLTPSQILSTVQQLPQTVGGIPGVGSIIPELGGIPLPTKGLSDILAIPSIIKTGTGGEWQSAIYAADLNAHHPKFKFLFKVMFVGFGTQEFYRYVHRCDKPRVRINHQDVNYYNFRTRVQTGVTYEPLSMAFLDEIGNTVNEFFTNYMKQKSGTASGNYGIHTGFGASTSSRPYTNGGYSDGRKIIIEQVFANGTRTNRFTFFNPRIESFDFDELNMEDSNGNLVTITFTYDAFTSETLNYTTSYSWGQADLLRGGGTSYSPNAGGVDGISGDSPVSAKGLGVGNGTSNPGAYHPDLLLQSQQSGSALLGAGASLLGGGSGVGTFNQPSVITSGLTTLATDVQSTLTSVFNGSNLKFGGSSYPTSAQDVFSTSEHNAASASDAASDLGDFYG